jgi:hypothetical protein
MDPIHLGRVMQVGEEHERVYVGRARCQEERGEGNDLRHAMFGSDERVFELDLQLQCPFCLITPHHSPRHHIRKVCSARVRVDRLVKRWRDRRPKLSHIRIARLATRRARRGAYRARLELGETRFQGGRSSFLLLQPVDQLGEHFGIHRRGRADEGTGLLLFAT